MKHIRIGLCLVLALMLSLTPAALANQLPVPAPTEAPAAQSGGGLPVPDIPQPKIELLPHPGTFLGEEGELALTGYEFDGAVWDVWYIPMEDGWGDRLTEWLKACREAGYTWKPGTTEGNTSYEVTDGEKRALLLPDYYGQIMFMKQDGLEMAEFAYVAPEVPELQLGQMHLVYNGVDYGMIDDLVGGMELDGTVLRNTFDLSDYSSIPFNALGWNLPWDIRTGDAVHLTKADLEDFPDGYVLNIDYTRPDGNGRNKNGIALLARNTAATKFALVSKEDYLDMRVIYRDEEMIRGTIEAVLKDGTVEMLVEFWLPIE